MHYDRDIKTFWAAFGLALGVCLAACSLNPQPLPPGTGEPTGSTAAFGNGEGSDASKLSQSADGASDAAVDADATDGNAADGPWDGTMPPALDGSTWDACAVAPNEDAGKNCGDGG